MPFKLPLKSLFRLFLKRSIVVLSTLLLLACAEQAAKPQQGYSKDQLLTQKAEQSVNAARQSTGLEKAQHLLEAAQSYYELNQVKQAETLLAELDDTQLSAQSLGQYTTLYAPILLDNNEHFRAREELVKPRLLAVLTTLPMPLQVELRRQRGDLFSLLGEDRSAVAEWVDLSKLLSDPAAVQDTHNKIWQVLTHTPDSRLFELTAQAQTMELKGWYQLAFTVRNISDINLQQRRIEQWRVQWPGHPAVDVPPSDFGALASAALSVPSHLALLVPLSGSYGEAGTVIRNGFLASYYDNLGRGGQAPSVRIYDTSKGAIEEIYQQAVADQADMVIGPLRKENLAALTELSALPVPVIGLNYLDDQAEKQGGNGSENYGSELVISSSTSDAITDGKVYQFGLSIADEAEQVAERAWLEGHRSALVMTPATAWGERARSAFSRLWVSRGGNIISTIPYSLGQSDFSGIIKPALQIDEYERRATQPDSPHRRQDIDMIFLVAQPGQGRSIKPTLDFYYAHDLPIYATSHIYVGTESADMNRDLEGIRFSAMPWTLPGMVPPDLMPDSHLRASYRHLYTLGIDAYLLHQYIALMQASPQIQVFGHTGTLTLSSGSHIKRTQPWAEFKNNRVIHAPQVQEY